MGVWEEDCWRWVINTGMAVLSHAAANEKRELLEILEGCTLIRGMRDSVVWSMGGSGVFSVNSLYLELLKVEEAVSEDVDTLEALRMVWKARVPSKVKIFAWRMLLNRLRTRELLVDLGIVQEDTERVCVFCLMHLEERNHLFLSCSMITKVWDLVYQWLGISCPLRNDCAPHFAGLLYKLQGLCNVNRVTVFWLATCWCLWNQRNDIIFKNGILDVGEVADKIKLYTWWWLGTGSKKKVICN
ncbi:uncharacterized protein LOC131648580 [Vicia villosa]|uniref:uncharacterized protein LOC131648580 n=1 Tax=Vicia villosa TaxID=3911 RepID=UPI00273AC8F7|nr:uncharacterized protein LOC131648580 [Vicia villosa]